MKNLLFPKICYGCGRVGYYLCNSCQRSKVDFIWGQICHVCKQEVTNGYVHKDCKEYSYVDGVMSIAKYTGVIQDLVKEVKYKFVVDAIPELAKLACKRVLEHKSLFDKLAVSYVPASNFRVRWRGFNQSELLAKEICVCLEMQFIHLLERSSGAGAQAKLNRGERLRNLANKFYIPKCVLQQGDLPQKVVLVDDVITTGSTLEQCAKVLKQQGVREVYGLTIASG